MGYGITEKLISKNRSYEKLVPDGFVIHSTATPGATDENEQAYFNNNNIKASAHYFIDWDSITRTIPENEVAWHAGYTANHKYLSVEMCEPKDYNLTQFEEVWKRTVWLVADACVRYNWTTGPNVWSHRGISNRWNETNHIDPIPYLQKYGKTWEELLLAIDNEIDAIKIKNLIQNNKTTVKSLIIYQGEADERAANYLADYLHCPVVDYENFVKEILIGIDNIYVIGGMVPFIDSKAKIIKGDDRFNTMAEVLKFIENG